MEISFRLEVFINIVLHVSEMLILLVTLPIIMIIFNIVSIIIMPILNMVNMWQFQNFGSRSIIDLAPKIQLPRLLPKDHHR